MNILRDRFYNSYNILVGVMFGVMCMFLIDSVLEVNIFAGEVNIFAGKVNAWANKISHYLFFVLVCATVVCLWWWYAVFFGHQHSPTKFSIFALDFVALGVFAFGTAVWNDPKMYLIAIAMALILLIIRVFLSSPGCLSKKNTNKAFKLEKKASKAVINISGFIVALLLMIPFTIIVFGIPFSPKNLVMASAIAMVLGIGFTIYMHIKIKPEASPIVSSNENRLALLYHHVIPFDTDKNIELKINRLKLIVNNESCKFCDIIRHSPAVKWSGEPGAMSVVHTMDDEKCQSFLVNLTSIDNIDEMRNKAKIMHFCHWIDDLYDQKILKIEKYNTNCKYMIKPIMKDLGINIDRTYLESAIKIISQGSEPNQVQNGDIKFPTIYDDTVGTFSNNSIFKSKEAIILMSKSAYFLWMNVEKWENLKKSKLCFYYEFLFGSFIYYHNVDVEKYIEHNPCDIKDGTMKGILDKIKDALCGKEGKGKDDKKLIEYDERAELRIWTIRSAAVSFSGVLPEEIYKKYMDVADALENTIKKDSPNKVSVN